MNIRVKIIVPLIVAAIATSFGAFAQTLTHNDLKINTAPVINSLSYISQLTPVSYEYNRSDFKQLHLQSGKQFGFDIAKVKQVLPSVVTEKNSWYTVGKGNQKAVAMPEVDAGKLVPLLVGAIKEQQAQIEQLKAEVQQLKAK
ncbi:tail fiber domain-containing protein [Mucilaginibacter litoreus]|uniref:Tail fiber domain-containing protein n=1 Tax=Mucilaginibacter litoreus TaxID=1048221 RepID=A0ABW3AW41_9SPHI